MLREWIKKLAFRERASSEAYIAWLRKQGVRFGDNNVIVDVRSFSVDMTRPFLVNIGSDITFSDHVTILTHDYSWSVVARAYPGEIYPSCGPVTIGNNVFVGSHAIILQNVTIGNNVIIGAGSIVTRDVPDGTVVAGTPAKPVTTVEALRAKRAGDSLSALRGLLTHHRAVYGRDADDYALREHLVFYQSPDDIQRENPQYYNDYRLDAVQKDLRVAEGREALIRKVLDDAGPSE